MFVDAIYITEGLQTLAEGAGRKFSRIKSGALGSRILIKLSDS